MGLRAAIYTRVSTEEQRDYGYSIDGQIRELSDYCKRKKYDIVDIYNDAGFSGKNMNRPNLERLLNDIKKGIIDVIVAIKVDRLTRDGYDGQWLLKECNKHDVELDLLYEPYDVNTANGEMMYGLNLLFAQRERKEIASRTKRGLEEAVKEGKYPNRAPIGYIKNEENCLVLDPIMSVLIKEVFDLYADGMSMTAIAEKFKKENRYNRANAKWRYDQILKILTNSIYKGELHWGRTTQKGKKTPLIIPNHSPKIVSKELFDKCQEQIEKNKHGGYGEHTHLFTATINCPYCHKIMSNYFAIKQRKDGKKEFYYVMCKNKKCDGYKKIYSSEKIENEILVLLDAIAQDYKSDKYSLLFPYQEKNQELDAIKKSISKLKHEEEKLMELYLNSSIDVELINKKNETIKNEINILEIKKINLENNIVNNTNNSIKNMLADKEKTKLLGTSKIWHMLDRKSKRKIISKYIKSIDIFSLEDKSIVITDIVFNNELIKKEINELTEIALNCIKESNKKLIVNKPTLDSKLDNDSYLSLMETLNENKYKFLKIWNDIMKSENKIYPIYDLSNVLKDIKVKINPIQ